jgi:hypothetical protein
VTAAMVAIAASALMKLRIVYLLNWRRDRNA